MLENLRLQLFADGGEDNNGVEGEQGQQGEQQNKVVFTPEQQSEVDRIISKNFEKWQAKATKEQAEAQRLASMNAEEKARYEIEQSKKEIEDMRKNFTLQQNKTECMKILAEKNIDVSLADFVVAEDAETMKANIDKIDKAFRKSVETEINNRLKSTTPKRDLGMPTGEVTKEVFNKMNLDQQQELYTTNKDLYLQLIK